MQKGTRSRMAVGAFCFAIDDWECAPQEKLLPAVSVQGRSAGPEAGRGVPSPPSLPLDSTHPATQQLRPPPAAETGSSCWGSGQVGAIALTLFSLLHLKPLSRCATAPPRGSGHARKLCGLTKNFPAAPRFRRKQALQMPFSFTTPSVKMGFRNARRRF